MKKYAFNLKYYKMNFTNNNLNAIIKLATILDFEGEYKQADKILKAYFLH